MMNVFYAYKANRGLLTMVGAFGDKLYCMCQGSQMTVIPDIEELVYVGAPHGDVTPQTLAKMVGRLMENTEMPVFDCNQTVERFKVSDLSIFPSERINLDIMIGRDTKKEFWGLKIKDRMTGEVYCAMPYFENAEEARTTAKRYIGCLQNMNVYVEFNFNIDKK